MLHIRDISLKKRILTAQFLMVFIPVLLLFVAGAAMLGALRLAGTARQNDFAALWPMHGPALSIQYAIDELRIEADKHKELRLKSFENAVSILENAGLSVAIAGTDGPVYVTPGTSTDALARQALPKATLDQQAPLPDMHSDEHHAMHSHDHTPPMMVPQGGERPQDDEAEQLLWTRDGLFFSYTSPVTGTTVRAAGRLPFLAQERMKVGPQKAVVEGLLLLIVGSAILFIVCLGVYLSRLLSEQILGPLGALREASARIRTGDLATPLPPMAGDEMGDACRDFDAMRAELRDAREKQARYDQSRKELIAGISHDLATPLTLLKGYADGLLSGLAATEEKREQYAQRIYGAACTMERLVRNLRMFSRLELGRMVLTPEPVALDAYFADYVAEEAPALRDRGLVLTLAATPPEGHARAAIDRDAFARVVDNILGNAIKYKEGATVAMELGVAVQGAQCVVTFADHGSGVPEDALPHLFETFYRTDKARTDTKKGSGLGLAICREIITALGGRIAASATKGGGLTITIHLPVVKEPGAVQPPETASQEKGDANPQ